MSLKGSSMTSLIISHQETQVAQKGILQLIQIQVLIQTHPKMYKYR